MKTVRLALAGFIFLAAVATVVHLTADDRERDRDNRLRTALNGFNKSPLFQPTPMAASEPKSWTTNNRSTMSCRSTVWGSRRAVAHSPRPRGRERRHRAVALPGNRARQRPLQRRRRSVHRKEASGTLTAASVITHHRHPQQIGANELDEVIAAIQAGNAYVNVHSAPHRAARSAGRSTPAMTTAGTGAGSSSAFDPFRPVTARGPTTDRPSCGGLLGIHPTSDRLFNFCQLFRN